MTTLSSLFSSLLYQFLNSFPIIFFFSKNSYYSGIIIKMTGIGDVSAAIWSSALINCINLIFAIVGVWLVDVLGRRTLAIVGLFGKFYFYLCVFLKKIYNKYIINNYKWIKIVIIILRWKIQSSYNLYSFNTSYKSVVIWVNFQAGVIKEAIIPYGKSELGVHNFR